MAGFSTLKGSWFWPWPWTGSYCIPSFITHRLVPTCQISVSGLSYGVVCVIPRLAILVQCRLVTDRQTDGHTTTAYINHASIASRGNNPSCSLETSRRSKPMLAYDAAAFAAGFVRRSLWQRGHKAMHFRVSFLQLQGNCGDHESEACRTAGGVVWTGHQCSPRLLFAKGQCYQNFWEHLDLSSLGLGFVWNIEYLMMEIFKYLNNIQILCSDWILLFLNKDLSFVNKHCKRAHQTSYVISAWILWLMVDPSK